jgi:hypothetical protein
LHWQLFNAARHRSHTEPAVSPQRFAAVTIPASALTKLPAKDYAAVRKLVRTGDIALCSGTQMFSRAIQLVTDTPWSHVALIVRLDELDHVMVLEAVAKIGVRAVPLSRFVVEDSDHHRPFPGEIVIARHNQFARKATPARLKAMYDFATDRLGAPFNGGEMTKILTRIAAGWFDQKMPRLLAPEDEFICSEYVAECLKRVEIDIQWNGRGFIAPGDFAADPRIKPVARVSRNPLPEAEVPAG